MLAAALLLASCAGSIDRAAFDREVQSRGGGLGADLPADALDALREELGDDLALHSVFVAPGYAVIEVRVPGTTADLDSYRYDDDLSDPAPVPGSAAGGPLEATLFRPERIAFDDLDRIVDEAIEVADLDGGYAENVSVRRVAGQGARIQVTVKNERHSATVPFRADGTLIDDEVTRS